jgi:hypothetical protein
MILLQNKFIVKLTNKQKQICTNKRKKATCFKQMTFI